MEKIKTSPALPASRARFYPLEDARKMVPDVNPFVKEIWLFSELTKFGATGAPTRGTKEKGDQAVKAVVHFLVEYLGNFEMSGLVYASKEVK